MAPENQESLDNEHLRDVEELEQQFRSDPSPEVYIPLVKAYLRRGYPQKAIDACKKGLKRGDSEEGQILLAKAFFDASARNRKNLKNASDEVSNILSRNPDSWEAHRLNGEIAIEQDDIQGAIKSLKRAYELNPSHPQARMLLQSLGVEVNDAPTGSDVFYIDVETGFVPPQEDSFLKAFRDIALFLIVILAGVIGVANNSISEKKVRALIMLGRNQQALNSYQGLTRAAKIYETVRKKFDENQPFALIHLSETHYALWKNHNRKDEHLKKFKDYFAEVTKVGEKELLENLASYESLRMLNEYNRGQEMIAKGNLSNAETVFRQAKDRLKARLQVLPVSTRLNWVYGLLYEALQKPRYARAHLKRAAELGWNSPYYRWRLAHHYLETRAFAAAHSQYENTSTQAKQSVNLVRSFLTAPDKQKNENCWIDPPMLFEGAGVPTGLGLTTTSLLTESLIAAFRAEDLSKCPFHPYFRKQYKANPIYLPASIGDVISILDAGVGMSVGYEVADELDEKLEKVKKAGNLSPHIHGWYFYAKAKAEYYKGRYKKAGKFLEQAFEKVKYEPFFYALRGLLEVKEKKYDDAVKSFEKSYKLGPYLMQSYIESIKGLLDVRVKDDDDDDKMVFDKSQTSRIEGLLEKMKKIFKEHSDYLYLKGLLAFNKGDNEAAEKLWTKALDDTKAPYYGDHYDSNIAMGKMWVKRADKFPKDRKYRKKEDYEDLVAGFKLMDKEIKAKIKANTQAKSIEKVTKEYEKTVEKLKDNRRPSSTDMKVHVGMLREALFEKAGSHFQAAMSSRPGAVEGRMQTGLIYFKGKSWNDSTGHFTISAAGFLRDLDYEGAKKAYGLLATAIINAEDEKPNKKLKEKDEKLAQRFKFLAVTPLRKAYLSIATASKKKGKKKKTKLEKKKKAHLLKTIDVIASTLENAKLRRKKKVKELAEDLRSDAKVVEEKGILAWFKVFKKRNQERASKGKGRRRR